MADDTTKNKPQTPEDEPKAQSDLEALKAEIAALKASLAEVKASPQVQAVAQAEARAQAEEEKPTETVPGGLYLLSDGKTLVNANRRRVDKTGKPLSEDDAYLERPR